MTQYAVGPRATQIWAGTGQPSPVLLANQDTANPVTIGEHPNVAIGAMNADVIPPLGSIAYTGNRTLYAIAAAGTAALLVIPGGTSWAPSPSQVAAQIQVTGVPPAIPNLSSASVIGANAQPPTTFFTFSAAGRIWAAHLSFAVASNASYTGGTTQLYARIRTGSGLDLTVVETAIGGPQTNDSGDADLAIGGIPVNGSDTLKLDVNNNSPMAQGVMHASAVVLYSIP